MSTTEMQAAKQTAAALAAPKTRRPRGSFIPFELEQWPELPSATTIRQGGAKRSGAGGLRLNVRQLRKTGLDITAGLRVMSFKGRILLRNEGQGPLLLQMPNKMMYLPTARLAPEISGGATVIEGPGYAVVTTPEDARTFSMAGTSEVNAEPWQRLSKPPALLPCDLDALGGQVLGWKYEGTDRGSRIPEVRGHLWGLAGFGLNMSLRITRYQNATVVEPCAPEERDSVLIGSGAKRVPRHFFGVSLCDFGDVGDLCAIALPNKLIVTHKGTSLGQALPVALQMQRPVPLPFCNLRDRPKLDPVFTPKFALEGWVDKESGNQFEVTQGLLRQAGIPKDAELVAQYFKGNQVMLLSSAGKARVGPAARRAPRFSLKKADLSKAGTVRVFIAQGHLVVSTLDSPFTAVCIPPAPKPEQGPAGEVEAGAISAASRPHPVHFELPLATGLEAPLHGLPESSMTTLGWADYPVLQGRVQVWGVLWKAYGFPFGQPVRVTVHENAIVIEACDLADKMFCVGSPSAPPVYRRLHLAGTPLADSTAIRALFMKGRVVLVDADSPLARVTDDLPKVKRGRNFRPQRAHRTYGAIPVGKHGKLRRAIGKTNPVPPPLTSAEDAQARNEVMAQLLSEGPLNEYSFDILGWFDHLVIDGEVQIGCAANIAAGILPGRGARLTKYDNAVAIYPCSDAKKHDFLNSRAYLARHARLIPLSHSVLKGEMVVRAVVAPTGVFLTAPDSALGQRCPAYLRGVHFE